MKDLKKRYWIFTFATYYPSGGITDIEMTFDDLNQAKQAFDAMEKSDINYILDKQTGETVLEFFLD